MVVAEVVEATDDKHTRHQGIGLLGQMTGATRKPGKALAEGGIQSFDESGVDDAAPLAEVQELENQRFTALHNPPLDCQRLV